MKKFLSIVTLAAVMASCTSTPDNTAAVPAPQTPAVDTTGLAQFQAYKRQQELMRLNENYLSEEAAPPAVAAAPSAAAVAKAPARRSSSSRSTASRNHSYSPAEESGSMNSTSGNAAKAEKKGWSKAAKGAAIGAGSGAVIGAVVNKKNRAVGGVIGGVAGGAVGYGIGRHKDKKDGRY